MEHAIAILQADGIAALAPQALPHHIRPVVLAAQQRRRRLAIRRPNKKIVGPMRSEGTNIGSLEGLYYEINDCIPNKRRNSLSCLKYNCLQYQVSPADLADRRNDPAALCGRDPCRVKQKKIKIK